MDELLLWAAQKTTALTLLFIAIGVGVAVEIVKRSWKALCPRSAFADWWLAGAVLGAGAGLLVVELSLGGAVAGLVVGALATGGYEYLKGLGGLLGNLKGAGPTPLLAAAIGAGLLFSLAGCQAESRYVLDSTAEGAQSVNALETGIQESRDGLTTRLQQETDGIFAAYQADLATLIVGVRADAVTTEQAAAKLASLAIKFRKANAVAETDRARAFERYNRMLEHTASLRAILANVFNLEMGRATVDQKLQDFKVMAVHYAAEKFGLPVTVPTSPIGPPAPAVDSGPAVPAVVAEPAK